MKRFTLLGFLLLLSTPLFAQSVYYSTSVNHNSEIATAGVKLANSLGLPSNSFDPGLDAQWPAALAGASVIFIGQSSSVDNLSGATVANIASFVAAGGVLAVLRDTDNLDLLNGVLGASMTLESSYSNNSAYDATKQATVAGSTYDTAPALLPNLNDAAAIDYTTLPGGAIAAYVDQYDHAHVMNHPLGSGQVVYLSWDWCCGDSAQDRADWDAALLSAVTLLGITGPPMIPTLSEFGLSLLAGLMLLGAAVGFRRFV